VRDAQVVVESALDDPEERRAARLLPRREPAQEPARRAGGALDRPLARRRPLEALVERHRDVDAERLLNREAPSGVSVRYCPSKGVRKVTPPR
jgi:hypothetical protein